MGPGRRPMERRTVSAVCQPITRGFPLLSSSALGYVRKIPLTNTWFCPGCTETKPSAATIPMIEPYSRRLARSGNSKVGNIQLNQRRHRLATATEGVVGSRGEVENYSVSELPTRQYRPGPHHIPLSTCKLCVYRFRRVPSSHNGPTSVVSLRSLIWDAGHCNEWAKRHEGLLSAESAHSSHNANAFLHDARHK